MPLTPCAIGWRDAPSDQGARLGKVTVEIKTADGKILSYEQVRAQVNARGDLMHQVWFWHP